MAITCLFVDWGWYLLLLWIALATVVSAQSAPEIPLGVAWQVKGLWRVDGQASPVQTGDAVKPGSLLWPITGSPAHSITILLPDGQRILYECFQAEDCGRGFRVPSLYRRPDPKAVSMMWRIHAALAGTSREPESALRQESSLPRDEAVAMLDAQARVEVTGLVAALPDGQYTYTAHALGHGDALPIRKTFDKKGASVILDIQSPGLYDVIIADRLNTPRVDLLIAGVKQPQGAIIRDSFRDAKARMEDWNGDYQGWPMHDFQRAYLEALVLDINPQIPHTLSVSPSSQKTRSGEVAEPVFTPKPGLFQGDTAVTLRCDTPGATIHFTVDGSQPLTFSPVYTAPIMVKGTALTIKAFATAEGKNQSSVVTGIFRIAD
ncbi:MAG TPA: chitobiase/beta-hexosaminidase C-terminal domain-containing protein [Terracidiphilus sp.]|nr:chitobiase/beta-hexosaminidase C-terminal domain-containing protein [Terracidiphilus sp.]